MRVGVEVAMGTPRILAAGLTIAVVLTGCGDDGGGDDGALTAQTTATTGTTAGGTDEEPAGEVPDPCALLDAGEVTDLLGADPGTGTASGPVPDVRKVCIYSSGLILAVEVAGNYDSSVAIIRDDPLGATVEDVDGVGAEAIWQDFSGGVGQLVALGDAYFVGVSVPTGGQPAAQAITEAMLAALE
jgi:hypothetical protein